MRPTPTPRLDFAPRLPLQPGPLYSPLVSDSAALEGLHGARGESRSLSPDRAESTQVTQVTFSHDRFLTRARALFYARLAFLVLGLGVIGLPSWSQAFGLGGKTAFAVYLVMVAYSAANYALLPKAIGKNFTFVTLCLDLCVLVWIVSITGGLRSPFLAAQLLFTTLFVVLFPTPLAVVPPLLTFPVVAKLDQALGGHAMVQIDIFILLWYSAINCILVYVMVYLNERDRMRHGELHKMGKALRDMAIVEERNRLAREIHDGLGGVISSVVIQSEYLLNMIDGSEVRARLSGTSEARAAVIPTIRKELTELHEAAEQSMDELRRSLRMMKENFDSDRRGERLLQGGRGAAQARRALCPRRARAVRGARILAGHLPRLARELHQRGETLRQGHPGRRDADVCERDLHPHRPGSRQGLHPARRSQRARRARPPGALWLGEHARARE